jgi:hypothetical protein
VITYKPAYSSVCWLWNNSLKYYIFLYTIVNFTFIELYNKYLVIYWMLHTPTHLLCIPFSCVFLGQNFNDAGFMQRWMKRWQWITIVHGKTGFFYKILSNILLSVPYADEMIWNDQCGFQRQRSSTDQIFCICQIIERILENNGRTPQLFFITSKKPTNQLGNTIFSLNLIYLWN